MPVDPHLTGFIERFNRAEYFEAHEVLEELWLATTGNQRNFYKGLIQAAAVCLKLQQGKPSPAVRLAQRAASHLENYRPVSEGLNVDEILSWLHVVTGGRNVVADGTLPRLERRE